VIDHRPQPIVNDNNLNNENGCGQWTIDRRPIGTPWVIDHSP